MKKGFFSFLKKDKRASSLKSSSSKESLSLLLNSEKYYHNFNCPNECSLLESMPELIDQGERATCSAQAAATLLEYCFEYKYKFSSQFLYWATKRLDGTEAMLKEFHSAKNKYKLERFKAFLQANPELKNKDKKAQELAYANSFIGTDLSILKRVIEEFGVCEYSLMPYAWDKNTESEAGSIESANEDLLAEIMQDSLFNAAKFKTETKILNANSIDDYRNRLSGVDDFDPMPVVFSIELFESDNNTQDDSGWFSMPSDNQKSIGGHSMLAVGYVDTPLIAGGGYIIARNSWGESWAWNYENSGYARIPYAYISKYAYPTALSILSENRKQSKSSDRFARYSKIATEEMRNRHSKFNIAQGDRIIVDLKTKKVDLDTKENRIAFEDNGFSWEE